MFRITSKVKIAAGVAAGALMLGAAGAYAATANNTITVQSPTPIPLPSGGPTLISVDGKTLTLPTTKFTNQGECISFFAKNRDFALAPSPLPTTLKLSKNFHGKLVSGLHDWCKSQVTSTTKPDGAETETPDATTDSTDTESGAPSGHGHGHGHNPTA